MDIRDEYLGSVGVSDETYRSEGSASKRVRSMYGTARTGRLKNDHGDRFWKEYFEALVDNIDRTPIDAEVYDAEALESIKQLTFLLKDVGRGNFGHAQKMFNLFMKDCWALRWIPPEAEPNLHVPIDRRILQKLTRMPPGWQAWTKATLDEDAEIVVAGYRRIQNSFRTYWQETGPRFSSPIEFDQVIWHRIRLVD